MTAFHHSQRVKDYYTRNHTSGGGKLVIPKTNAERTILYAKLLRLKREFLARNGS